MDKRAPVNLARVYFLDYGGAMNRLSLLLLPLLLWTAAAQAQVSAGSREMLLALAQKDYQLAYQRFAKLPPQEAARALLPAAQRNNTPAQWMLAQAYWAAGEKEKSGRWVYTARMGTLLDASVCMTARANEIESMIATNYKTLLSAVRKDHMLEQEALRFAGNHYVNTFRLYQDPAWTCRMWFAQPDKSKTRSYKILAQETWVEKRKAALTDILNRSGLSKLLDNIREESDDPLKRNFDTQRP